MKSLFLRNKVILQKKIGETPLQTLGRFRDTHPRYKDIPATYAGRLDPMASGKLLVLFGEECKKKEKYLNLDKVYEVEVLLGASSDTGDVLGVLDNSKFSKNTSTYDSTQVQEVLQKEVGTFPRAYPIFSSKTVNGKPLFMYALEGTLETIDVPTHSEAIHSITYTGSYTLTTSELKQRITSLLALAPVSYEPSKTLGADFRIADVRKSWEKLFDCEHTYQVLKIVVRCGSGSYMRSLATRIGEALGTQALALSIHRSGLIKKDR